MKRRLPLVRVQPLAYSRQLRQSVLFRLQDVYHARIIAARRERPEKSKSRSTSERSAIATHKLPTLVWLLRRLSSLNAWVDRVLSFSPVLQPGGRVRLRSGWMIAPSTSLISGIPNQDANITFKCAESPD